jgi:hypothetical protein
MTARKAETFLGQTRGQRLGAIARGVFMVDTEFETWRRECEAVHKEMDRLLLAGRPQSPEERQVRQLQFTALIERRDAAARDLLRSCIRDKLYGEADAGSPTKPHAHR